MLFGLHDPGHPGQCFLGSVGVRRLPQPGGKDVVGVFGLGLVDRGAGKPHKGPQQHIPLTLCRGAGGRKNGFHSVPPFGWIVWVMQTESMKRKNEEIA